MFGKCCRLYFSSWRFTKHISIYPSSEISAIKKKRKKENSNYLALFISTFSKLLWLENPFCILWTFWPVQLLQATQHWPSHLTLQNLFDTFVKKGITPVSISNENPLKPEEYYKNNKKHPEQSIMNKLRAKM